MDIVKYFLFATGVLLLGSLEATYYRMKHIAASHASICKGEEDCVNNDGCLCYCSGICNFRKKHLGGDGKQKDDPVYIEDDSYGIHCYCKPWDVEVYRRRCINGENVPRY